MVSASECVRHGTASRLRVYSLVLILARMTQYENVKRETDGMRLVLHRSRSRSCRVRSIHKMDRHGVDSNMLLIDGLEIDDLLKG